MRTVKILEDSLRMDIPRLEPEHLEHLLVIHSKQQQIVSFRPLFTQKKINFLRSSYKSVAVVVIVVNVVVVVDDVVVMAIRPIFGSVTFLA